MKSEIISFCIPLGKEKPIFHLGVCSLEEEQAFVQKFNDIADKNTGEYEVCVHILKTHSAKMPETFDKKGKRVPLIEDAKTSQEAIEKYFADRTFSKERIANQAVIAYREQMNPEPVFLSLSGQ